MSRRSLCYILALAGILLFPFTSPAPLVYRAGEGWSYEPVGGAKWQRTRAKDQFDVAKEAFDKKDYGLAAKASRRTVKVWPLSDYAPKAQYILARSYDLQNKSERAFKEYQNLIEKYPKAEAYAEVLERQFYISNQFLAGRWFKLWGYIPFFPSMDKTVDMYDKVIRNGPYSQVAPQAQMNIGKAREKQKDYFMAVKAYERAADRYHDQKGVAADAVFKAGMAYYKQALEAEYDQSVSGNAIATFSDFITMFPNDPRITEADKIITKLKTEQARGATTIAKYYEKRNEYEGAVIYYNEAIARDPESKFAADAKKKIDQLKPKVGAQQARRVKQEEQRAKDFEKEKRK